MRPVLVIVGLAVVLGCAAVLSARAPMLAPGTRVDRLVVDKSERSLVAYEGEREVARLRVAIGFGGEGPKRWEGDGRTPEGTYRIDRRHVSRDYHRFLHVSYPNADDRRRYAALREAGELPLDDRGRPVGIGGDIGVHGTGGRDWIPSGLRSTLGCVMVDDDEARALFEAVVEDATIEIRP
ncbi:MAG: L,D-transpeptidase family protein [Sandaracinus sp.]|nr:L,D-transpeptidase family protein [Sandaracinus sp.]MCB9615764.1 L,D-transpeptidase family protein [Sandaracinus sp.]MCB9623986.1 L,D-transpeptidase family protein [Sandaracinus sp.]